MIVYPAVLAGCRTPHSQHPLRLQGYLPTLNLLAPPVDMEVVEIQTGVGGGRMVTVMVVFQIVVLTADH